MGNLPLHFEGWAEDDISLAEGWSEVSHQLKRQKGIVRISFSYFEQGGFLPTKGKRGSLLSRRFGGACLLL